MVQNDFFTLHEKKGLYFIRDNFNVSGVKTHQGTDFPGLSKELGDLLLEDLLNIDDSNFYVGEGLRHSLVYCVLSTFIEAKGKYELLLDVEMELQWDRVFRLNPGPPRFDYEYGAIKPIREYLKDDWHKLPLNYTNSIEEMEEAEVPKLPQKTIDLITSKMNNLNKTELFVIELLHNLFGNASVSMVIFWVLGVLNTKELSIIQFVLIELRLLDDLGVDEDFRIKENEVHFGNLKKIIAFSKKEEIWSCLTKTDEDKPLFC